MKDAQLRVALVDPSDVTREALRNLLLGVESVWLEAESNRYDFFPDVVHQSKPDVAMVAMDAETQKASQLIVQLAADLPRLPILAVSSRTDGQFILQTLRSGAKDFLPQPVVLEDLLRAIRGIRAVTRGGSGELKGAQTATDSMVIAVAGARGGVGCTTLAVNLGCALAQDKGHSVALIDLDLALGDADVSLDVMPNYTLADVALNIERLDMTFLRRSLSQHATGLFLLPHPVQLEDAGLIQEEHLQRVIGLLRATYSHIVLDLSKSFRPLDFAGLLAADKVLLVAQLELSSLRNVVRLLMAFNNMEGMAEKTHVVLTRVGAENEEISLKKAEETMGRSVYWQIPNDSKTMLGSRNEGIPLVQYAPKTKICQSIQALAAALTNKGGELVEAAPPPAKREKKLFSFLKS
jgi:pilus assembly protein CpaE